MVVSQPIWEVLIKTLPEPACSQVNAGGPRGEILQRPLPVITIVYHIAGCTEDLQRQNRFIGKNHYQPESGGKTTYPTKKFVGLYFY